MRLPGFRLKNCRLVVALALGAFLASCASLPSGPASVEAGAWVAANRPVVLRVQPAGWQAVLTLADVELPRELAPLLTRTRTLWVGLPEPSTDFAQTLSGARIAVEGDFPRAALAWALFWNPPPAPWTVSRPRNGLVLLQQGAADLTQQPAFSAASLPAGDVVLSFEKPGPTLLGPILERMFSPLLLVAVLDAPNLEGRLTLEMADPRGAAAALVLLKLAGGLLDARLQQDLVWRTEGSLLIGEPLTVPTDELRLWLTEALEGEKN